MSGPGASVAVLCVAGRGSPMHSGGVETYRRCPSSLNPSRHVDASRPEPGHMPKGGVGPLALGALGVVYGDIGTSPLYAMDQIFRVAPARTPEDALGAVSLVVWTLTLIVAIKYALLVLRAQNDGEGGVFALYGLLHDRTRPSRPHAALGADGRRGPADRRRHDHAGDQRALGGRGAAVSRRRDSPPRSSRSRSGCSSRSSPCSTRAPRALGSVFGPIVRRLVRRHRGARGGRDRRGAARSSPPSIRSTASSSWAGRISPARSCCSAP